MLPSIKFSKTDLATGIGASIAILFFFKYIVAFFLIAAMLLGAS